MSSQGAAAEELKAKTLVQTANDHEDQIKEFREALSKHPFCIEHGVKVDQFSRLDLMRFLLARDLKIDKAVKMYIEYLQWIEAKGNAVEEKDCVADWIMEKAYLWKTDKYGRPCMYMVGKNHDGYKRVVESSVKHAIFLLNDAQKRMDDETGISQFVAIVDLAGIGWKNYDVAVSLGCLKVLEKYYPERLGKIFMINTGFIFWALWKVISPVLPQRTKEKFLFFRDLNAARADLDRDFDKEDLLAPYGGTDPFQFRYVPEDERKGAPITPHYSKKNPQPPPPVQHSPPPGDELLDNVPADSLADTGPLSSEHENVASERSK